MTLQPDSSVRQSLFALQNCKICVLPDCYAATSPGREGLGIKIYRVIVAREESM